MVTEEDIREAIRTQRKQKMRIGSALIHIGALAEEDLVFALAHQMDIPVVELEEVEIESEALSKIPEDILRKNLLLPFHLEGSSLSVAVSDPPQPRLRSELAALTKLNLVFYMAPASKIESVLNRMFSRTGRGG